MVALERQRVSWSQVRPPAHVQNSPWYPALCPREKAILGFEMQRRPSAMAVDVGQSIGRERTSLMLEGNHVFGTITSSQRLILVDPEWSGASPRLLLGREALRIQGFPVDLVQRSITESGVKASDAFLFGLAGNCFHAVSYWSALISILVALPPLKQETVDRAEQEGSPRGVRV